MKNISYFIIILFTIIQCQSHPEILKESWITQPLSEWPEITMTNEISFEDTTFSGLANGFLVNTGKDTLAASCKHLFMVFEKYVNVNSIYLGSEYCSWKMYPKSDTMKRIMMKHLINQNQSESIGQFNTLKVRDWIIFEPGQNNVDVFPLKIRYTPVKTKEVVYAIGWGSNQEKPDHPEVTKMQVFRNMGDYFFTKTISTDHDPAGKSGSPVVDKNGYLVGIVSGAEGNLGVIGSIAYLKSQFDRYGINYDEEQ